jgi:molybdopterin synthase sulfur carrier subunit
MRTGAARKISVVACEGTHHIRFKPVSRSGAVGEPVMQRRIIDALEARYPMLCGAIRNHVTQRRRPFIGFFAREEDLSHQSPDAPVPEPVALPVGAIAGGEREDFFQTHPIVTPGATISGLKFFGKLPISNSCSWNIANR